MDAYDYNLTAKVRCRPNLPLKGCAHCILPYKSSLAPPWLFEYIVSLKVTSIRSFRNSIHLYRISLQTQETPTAKMHFSTLFTLLVAALAPTAVLAAPAEDYPHPSGSHHSRPHPTGFPTSFPFPHGTGVPGSEHHRPHHTETFTFSHHGPKPTGTFSEHKPVSTFTF